MTALMSVLMVYHNGMNSTKIKTLICNI